MIASLVIFLVNGFSIMAWIRENEGVKMISDNWPIHGPWIVTVGRCNTVYFLMHYVNYNNFET